MQALKKNCLVHQKEEEVDVVKRDERGVNPRTL